MASLHSDFQRVAAGGTRQGLPLWRSALRTDCTAILGPRSRRQTLCARFARCVQTAATRWLLMRAARADLGPALLVATEVAPTGYRPPRATRVGSSTEPPTLLRKGAPRPARARLCRTDAAPLPHRRRAFAAPTPHRNSASNLRNRCERSELGHAFRFPCADRGRHLGGVEDRALQQRHVLQAGRGAVIAGMVQRQLAAGNRQR